MTETGTRSVRVLGGRELCVWVGGGDSERSVLVMHGMPGSGLLYRRWIEDAAARGIRLISYDRPGYGRSTECPGRSIADCAADVKAIADDLGVERMGVWGWSAGGPYALACAAMLSDLVVAAAVLGSMAPWDAPGLDFFGGMGQGNVDEIELYFSDPTAARKKNMQDRDEVLATTVDQQTQMLATLLSATDAEILTGEFAERLLRTEQNGLARGDQGWWDDGAAHMSPWGFDIGSIRVPVKVWHGRHDRFSPFQHGQWLANHIPGAEAALSDSDGHLTLVTKESATCTTGSSTTSSWTPARRVAGEVRGRGAEDHRGHQREDPRTPTGRRPLALGSCSRLTTSNVSSGSSANSIQTDPSGMSCCTAFSRKGGRSTSRRPAIAFHATEHLEERPRASGNLCRRLSCS